MRIRANSRDIVTTILFGTAAFISGFTIAMPLALATGIPILPGIIMPIIINIFFVNAALSSKMFGAATASAFVYGLLSVPFAILGPPYFLPKIIVITFPTLFLDILIALKRTALGCAIGGFLCAFPVNFLMVVFLNLFGMPSIPEMMELLFPIQIILSAEGFVGGFLGWKIYCRLNPLV